jgi:hypothetical protein
MSQIGTFEIKLLTLYINLQNRQDNIQISQIGTFEIKLLALYISVQGASLTSRFALLNNHFGFQFLALPPTFKFSS